MQISHLIYSGDSYAFAVLLLNSEYVAQSLSNEFDNRAVHLVNTGGQKIAANRDDREQGFVAPSSQVNVTVCFMEL